MKRLLLIRHGAAEERELFAINNTNDEARPLISKGEKQLKDLQKKYSKLFKSVKTIYSSPLVRTKQTAELIFAKRKNKIKYVNELKPEAKLQETLDFLFSNEQKACVAIVSHEPNLSRLTNAILNKNATSKLPIKFLKGTVIVIDFDETAKIKAVISGIITPII